MSTVLISYYWYPWNNSGTFRWLGYSEFLDFDVLTSIEPKYSALDFSMPDPKKKTTHWGMMNAKLWGLMAPMKALKYKTIILTSPPETLILWAYIFQSIGKNVLLDMRDSFERDSLRGKFLRPIYRFFYKRIKKVIVAFQCFDSSKPCVYHGYDNIERDRFAYEQPVYYQGKVEYAQYLRNLRQGYIPTFKFKPKGYVCSSVHTIFHLGYKIDNTNLHPEIYTIKPISNEQAVEKIKQIL